MNTPHPELESLAALADPADPTSESNDVLAHVADCPKCSADLAALRGVRYTLRALPPIPMPDAVAARLESALRAAAAGADEPAGAGAPAELPATSVSVLPARLEGSGGKRSPTWMPNFSAAAAVTVLLFVALGAGIAVVATHASRSTKSAASAAASASSAGTVVTASGTHYQQSSIRSQVAALVLSHVPDGRTRFAALEPLAQGASAPAAGSAAAAAPAASSAAASSAAATSSAAPSAPASAFGLSSGAIRTAPSGPLAEPSALQACIVALVNQPETPVLVDYATYDGKPATIIVLVDPTTPSMLDLYVEYDTADCVKNGDVSYFALLKAAS